MDNTSNTIKNIIMPECIATYRVKTVGGIHGTLLAIIYSINCAAILIFNTLLIIGICKTRKKNKFTNSNKLFLFLCASDLLAGIVLMPIQIYYIHITPDISCLQTAVRAFFGAFPIVLSGTNILVITIDRYLMMAKHTFYKRWFSNKCIILCFTVEVAISFGWAIWYVWTTKTFNMKVHATFFVSLATYELILLVSVVILNIMMLFSVKEAQKNTLANRGTERVLSKTVTLISVSLVVCYIPSVIGLGVIGFFFFYSTNRDHLTTVTIVLIWSLVPTQINSGLNALIYLLRNSRMRSFYRSIFKESHGDMYDTTDSLASHKDLHRLSTNTNYKTYTKQQNSPSVTARLNGDSHKTSAL